MQQVTLLMVHDGLIMHILYTKSHPLNWDVLYRYRAARLHRLADWCVQPNAIVDYIPRSGTKNLASGLEQEDLNGKCSKSHAHIILFTFRAGVTRFLTSCFSINSAT
jgi:hypothetical protein